MKAQEKRNSFLKKEFTSSQDFEVVAWGLRKGCWVKNTFNEKINLQNFIERMRNSVSHPTIIDISSQNDFPSSGFTTLYDDNTKIKEFCFVNSPDTRENRRRYYTEKEVKNLLENNNNGIPSGVTATFDDSNSKYCLTLNSQPFIRVSKIELSVEELGYFVTGLANYLAQPLEKDWDGTTIKPLVRIERLAA